MKKSFLYILIVDLILVAIVSVLTFAIPYPHHNTATWVVSYIFLVLALLLFLVYAFFATKNNTLKSKVFGLSLMYVGVIYLIVQAIVSVIMIAINAFVNVPSWIVLVLSLILFMLACIGFITVKATTDIINKIEDKTEEKTKTFDLIKAKSQALYVSIDDEEIKKIYYEANEEIKYSDPVSNPDTASYEDEIENRMQSIKLEISDGKTKEEIAKSVDKLVDLVKERNLVIKTLKK